MSVTEADSTVLQPLTNGDINAAPASKAEVHDASSVSKENIDLNINLKEVLTSDRVVKATEILAAEALNPSVPEPDSVFDAQSSSEATLSLADASILSKNNGVTQEHTINGSSIMLDDAGMITEPTASVVEGHATSSNEDAFAKPKEDTVEPESVVNASIEKGTEGESSVEITKGLESADSLADAVASGAEDVSIGGAKSDSASVVTLAAAAAAADTAAIESQVGEVEPASVPSVTPAAEAVAGITEVPASSVESAVAENAIAPAVDVATELAPAIDEQTVAKQEVTSEAVDPIMVTETLHVASSVVEEVPIPLQEVIPAEAIQAVPSEAVPPEAEPVSVASPPTAEESLAQPEKVSAEASITNELPASAPEVTAVDVIKLSGSVTPVTSKPSPLIAPAEESAAVESKANVSEAGDAPSPAVPLIAAIEATEVAPAVEELITVQPKVALESSAVEVPGQVLESLSIESTTAEEIPAPATECIQGSTAAVEPAIVEKALDEGSDVAEVSASFLELVAEAEPQIIEQPPIESGTVEDVSVPIFAQEAATEAAPSTESLAVEHPPTESSVTGDVSAPEPEPISEPAPVTEQQPLVESSIVEEVLAPTPEPIVEAAPAVEPEVMDRSHIKNSVVEEVSAPGPEPLAEAASTIEAEAKNASTGPSVVEGASVPAPEPIPEAVPAAELAIEKPLAESSIVEEVSALVAEPLAGVTIAADPEVIEESPIDSGNAEERSAAVPEPPAEATSATESLVVEQPPIASSILEETPTSEEAPIPTPEIVEAASDVNSTLTDLAKADKATAAPEPPVITTPASINEGVVESVKAAEPGADAPSDNIPVAVEGGYSVEPETDIATPVEHIQEAALAAENDVTIEVKSEAKPVDTGRMDAFIDEATTTLPAVNVEESGKVQRVVSGVPEESNSEHTSVTVHNKIPKTTEDAEEVAPEGVVSDELSLLDTAVAPEEAATQTTSPPVNAVSDTPAIDYVVEEVEPDAQTASVEDGTETTLAKALATVADDPEPEPVAAVPATKADTPFETTSMEKSRSSFAADISPAANEPASPVAVLEDPVNAEEPVTAFSEAAATTLLPKPMLVQELPVDDNETLVSAEIPSAVEETTHEFEVATTATASTSEGSGASQEQQDASFVEPVLSVTAEEPTAAQGPAIPREEEAPDAVEKPAPTNSDVVEEHPVIEESAPAFSAATQEPVVPRDRVPTPVAGDEPALRAVAEETAAQDIPTSEEQEAPLAVVEEPTPAGAEEAPVQQQEEAAPAAAEPVAAAVTNADREAEETGVRGPTAPQGHQGEADINPAPASTADEEESAVVTGPLALDGPDQPAQDSFTLVAEGSMTPTLIVQDSAVSAPGMLEAQATALEKAAAVIDEPTITPAIATEKTAGPEELDIETTQAKSEIKEVETKQENSTILQAEETPVPNGVTDDLVPNTPADESIVNDASSADQSSLPTESPCEETHTAADNSTTDEAAAMFPHAEILAAENVEQAGPAENLDEAVKDPDDVSSANARSAECDDNVEATAAAPSTTPHPDLVSFAVTHTGLGGVQNNEGAQDDVSFKEQESISPAGAIEEPTQSEPAATEVRTVAIDVDSLPVEAEAERPNSSWMPSFQVMTVGRGVETEKQVPESEETFVSIPETGATNAAIQEKLPAPVEELPAVIIPVTTDAEEIGDDVTGTVIAPPQLLVDTSSLEEPTERSEEPTEQPRSWTPSYSVHSQGSPRQDNADLDNTTTQEEPPRSWTPSYSVHSQGSPLPIQVDLSDEATVPLDNAAEDQAHELAGLKDMEFATNEEIPVTDVSPAQETSPNISRALLDPRELDELPVEATNPDIAAAAEYYAAEPVLSDAVAPVEIEDASPAREVQIPQLVLDISEEATRPSTDDGEQSSTHLSTHSEQERPPSPWIPSYSVSVQGSPSQERFNPLDEILAKPDEVLAAIVPVAISSESAPIGAAEYKSLDTVISHQTVLPGAQTSTEAEDHHLLVSNISPAVVEAPFTEATEALGMKDDFTVAAISEASLAMKGLPVLVDDGEKIEDVSNTNKVPQALSSEEQEPPTSPWTPSYSVTTQGPNATSEAAELEPPPERAELADAPNNIAVPQDDAAIGPKDSVPSVVVDTADEIRDTPGEIFPTVEDTDEAPEQLDLRLVPLDETRVTEDALVSPNAVSPTTARSRLESSASSRFFPGSWFSSSYKAVDEGRTSLEVAQGEFVATKAAASVNDAADTSSVEETSSDESDEDAEAPESATSEQKRRWCVIM